MAMDGAEFTNIYIQMDLSRRQGKKGHGLAGMAWDEMSLVPVVTSSVNFTALEVYFNLRCGAIGIELYTGRSKNAFNNWDPFY